jgi:hypothetical protein
MQRCTIIRFFLYFAFLFASTVPAQAAFHTGGAGACGGCHINHASGGAGLKLLFATDPGSVCLTCHAGPGGTSLPSVFSFDGSALTPGGDFYWLNKTFSWVGGTSPGQRHGHNVIAFDFGLIADPDFLTAPGGSYPAAQLTCISCHDPHGRSQDGTANGGLPVSASGSYGQTVTPMTSTGSYRMLGGVGYSFAGYTFSTDAPVARQNSVRPFGENDASHVDYGAGMSEWCSNCHPGIFSGDHNAGGPFTHPSGSASLLTAEMAATYNSYINSSDSSGTIDTAYLQFVPFERGTTDVTLLDPTSSREASA